MVVRFRLLQRNVRNPIPLKIRRVLWACCTLNHTRELNALPLVWCYTTHFDSAYPTGFKAFKSRHGAEVWRRECELRRHPHHLTVVQNYEVHPKIASCCFKT
ncbi:hypothetical protein AVEN_124124-1 [Araneus ventricosus]|uniref:Uncharacterized protein n=1 Tax=Araneus ventricosus TaxID=182803 RepID=A0A4Y2IHX2_ARAVE|nr:hypothetical protein AVEN_124124-1 [Araneus ventricosus]